MNEKNPVNRAEAFIELGKLTEQIKGVEATLIGLKNREAELYAVLKIPYQGDNKPKRTRTLIPDETKEQVRRVLTQVIKQLVVSHNMKWISPTLIYTRAEHDHPNMDREVIRAQLRWLADSVDSPIMHNGMKGHGSSYTFDREHPNAGLNTPVVKS